ncbi:acetyl-CoA synthetase [Cavenderia fasciculata]|uniref:acetate--CoA ligase n=1 Tax=Cavenderia fasciculata TaxID=261658 RepID=F4PMV4_CACFS|nr:acetyl-CoA synthetase [Cavenderia fasciculata]EGG23698.1 acetyl-CoA synthetase [Cavenderia fasciculata]|eukprot:XP_004361549.1 acetyl-CoA synthetase [Cavenderia fasciculata]
MDHHATLSDDQLSSSFNTIIKETRKDKMISSDLFTPKSDFSEKCHIKSMDQYREMYLESINKPKEFWDRYAKSTLSWFQPYDKVMSGNFINGDITWFQNGKLNVSYNCIDRHLESKKDKVAIIYEGDSPDHIRKITYYELLMEVSRLANLLKSLGVKKGDTVAIYMPNTPEAIYSMLACARIGAIHSVIFAGFGFDSIVSRVQDAACKVIITADEGVRGGKIIPLKKKIDEVAIHCNTVSNVIVFRNTGYATPPHTRTILGDDRAPQNHAVLHCANRDPFTHEVSHQLCRKVQQAFAACARHGRRADQPRGVALVLQLAVLDPHSGKELTGNNVEGVLAIDGGWPGIARTVFGSHQRYLSAYMKQYPGYYFTGDGVKRDEDGYYWIQGRVDDVINVAGHRLGTAELESALVGHSSCAEAAVIGYPHDIKGQGILAFCTLKQGYDESDEIIASLKIEVRKIIGPFATPDVIIITPSLPKTRSGKIMRRILRKIACHESSPEQLGDISTLAEPEVVPYLIDKVGAALPKHH